MNPSICHTRRGDRDKRIVLHNPRVAKEKLANQKTKEAVVTDIIALGLKKPELMSALVDWVCSEDTAKEIGHRYALNKSVLSYWGRRMGLPMRRRGRHALLKPTPEHQRILALVHEHGVTGAAGRIGVSKQRVSQIVRRWEPRLRKRRTDVNTLVLPRRKRRPRRNIVISFRISTDEWQKLLAARPNFGELNLSGARKARGIVLHHIGLVNSSQYLQSAASPSRPRGL